MGVIVIINNDLEWMKHAYLLACEAEVKGEVPVGAVLVSRDNRLLGEGFNQPIGLNDPTAHAEVLAIRDAASKLQNYRLSDTTLYVTLEPCSMCAGAILHARCSRIVFATRDIVTGACGSKHNLMHSQVQIDEGVMQEACADLLSNFFKDRRRN